MRYTFGQGYRTRGIERLSVSKGTYEPVSEMHPCHALNVVRQMLEKCPTSSNEELLNDELFQALLERLQAVDEI